MWKLASRRDLIIFNMIRTVAGVGWMKENIYNCMYKINGVNMYENRKQC